MTLTISMAKFYRVCVILPDILDAIVVWLKSHFD